MGMVRCEWEMGLQGAGGDSGKVECVEFVGDEFVVREAGDHGGVVEAVGHSGESDLQVVGLGEFSSGLPEEGVCGDTAAYEEGSVGRVGVLSER